MGSKHLIHFIVFSPSSSVFRRQKMSLPFTLGYDQITSYDCSLDPTLPFHKWRHNFWGFWPPVAQTKDTKIQFFIILSLGTSLENKLFLLISHEMCHQKEKTKIFSDHTSIKIESYFNQSRKLRCTSAIFMCSTQRQKLDRLLEAFASTFRKHF